MPAPALTPDTLLPRIAATRLAALASGALQPIHTEHTEIDEHGTRFAVRWLSTVEAKHTERERAAGHRRVDFNPFLPPDPALTVGALGAAHLAVLNKYPVIDRHLLIITRAFEAQHTPLGTSDLGALACVLGPHGGLGFYNGGEVAGASQRHKHLQWIPHTPGEAQLGTLAGCGALPFRHAWIALDGVDWDAPEQAGEGLRQALRSACAQLGMPDAADPMPPYNLLLDRQRLLLVPRRREHWEDISVNALGFAGSLFVRRPAQIDAIRRIGPLQLLAEVGFPR
ncbi:phosphorylase [Pseudothauera nasutitermitis]|uniref:Phosphorylase n=1 Tax=Pseudothauera nasutitermitis TaxID=2565930 RepID=A0A4V6RX94_9RHOO|nr:phosphorylase [Pseudothauera nasutitermitis]THF66468.1 phosphorylase [Pseudothauera nasutitermitis]